MRRADIRHSIRYAFSLFWFHCCNRDPPVLAFSGYIFQGVNFFPLGILISCCNVGPIRPGEFFTPCESADSSALTRPYGAAVHALGIFLFHPAGRWVILRILVEMLGLMDCSLRCAVRRQEWGSWGMRSVPGGRTGKDREGTAHLELPEECL